MSAPLVMVPGVASDEDIWQGMPAAQVLMSGADTIDGMAQDILTRAPPRFALIGHSMGGYVALAMFAQAPERIERLALLSSAAAPDGAAQRAARQKTIEDIEADFEAVIARLPQAMLDPSLADGPLPARLAAMMRRVGKENLLRQQRATMERPDRRDLLSLIKVPLLVLYGEADRIVPPDRSREIASAVAHAKSFAIPKCGHIPMLEKPSETEAALRYWLS